MKAEVLNWVKAIKDSQLIEIRTFWRCFLNTTKSWEKFFVEETIKPNKGVCTPAPCLTYLIFMLCLTHLYHIHQMIYRVALYTGCLHLFTAALPFALPQYIGAPTDVQRRGQESSQESSAVVTAHSLAMQPLLVLAAAFLTVDIYHKYHSSSTGAVTNFHRAHLLGLLSPDDQW